MVSFKGIIEFIIDYKTFNQFKIAVFKLNLQSLQLDEFTKHY